MQRPVCAQLLILGAALGLASCGELKDERAYCTNEQRARGDRTCGRPLELEYVTAAIFAPSCGQAQCHSTFHNAGNRAFDTPEAVRKTLLAPGGDKPLLQFTSTFYDPLRDKGDFPLLISWLLPLNDVNKGVGRMPFDAPLPDRDIDLLEVWIRADVDADGNKLEVAGGTAHGAQCDPSLNGGLACNRNDLVQCQPDFNFGETMKTCAKGCDIIPDVCDDPTPRGSMVPCPTTTHPEAQCAKE